MKVNQINVENYKVKRNKKTKWQNETNHDVLQMYDRLFIVAMSVFEWEGLPTSVDEIYLEKEIINMGSVVFFKDEDMFDTEGEGVHLALKYMPSYQLDVYGTPMVRRAYADNRAKYRKTLTEQNSVIIYDNVRKISFASIIYDFAVRLVKVQKVINQNLEQQKRPYIIGASEELKGQMETFFADVSDNKPYFMVKDTFLEQLRESFNVFPMSADLIVNELNDYYDAIWNEFMTFVGVGTNASPKRERLVSAEVSSVNEQAQAFASARFKTRQRACKLINEKFGLNVSVRYAFDKEDGKEGDEDGTVYNKTDRSVEKPDGNKER